VLRPGFTAAGLYCGRALLRPGFTAAGLDIAEALDGGGLRVKRVLLIVAGTVFVGLGLLGVVLPILPITPFLLPAATCYMCSSRWLYHRLLTNRFFGEYGSSCWW